MLRRTAAISLEPAADLFGRTGSTPVVLGSFRVALADAEIDSRLVSGSVHVHEGDLEVAAVVRDYWARERRSSGGAQQPTFLRTCLLAGAAGFTWLVCGILLVVVLSLRAYELADPPAQDPLSHAIRAWLTSAVAVAVIAAAASLVWLGYVRVELWPTLPTGMRQLTVGLVIALCVAGYLAGTCTSAAFGRDNVEARALGLTIPSIQCVWSAAAVTALVMIGVALHGLITIVDIVAVRRTRERVV